MGSHLNSSDVEFVYKEEIKRVVDAVREKVDKMYSMMERQDESLMELKEQMGDSGQMLIDEELDDEEESAKWLLNRTGHLLKVKCLKKSDRLPVTSGRTTRAVTRFLATSAQMLKVANFPKDDWVNVISTRLKGKAKLWWKNNRNIKEWEEFVIKFITWTQRERRRTAERTDSGQPCFMASSIVEDVETTA